MIPLKTFKWLCVYAISFLCTWNAISQEFHHPNSESHSSSFLIASTSNEDKAIDGDLNTASSLNLTLSVGGSASQTLSFVSDIPAGTTLRLKIGAGSGLLGVNNKIEITVYHDDNQVGSSLNLIEFLTLLNGSSTKTLEISPEQTYNKVKIELSSLIGALASVKVFEAYYITGEPDDCDKAYDVLSGSKSALAGGLSGVLNPSRAIDKNEDSYASLAAIASLDSASYITALFYQPSVSAAHVLLGSPNIVLNIDLLPELIIHTYNSNDLVESFSASDFSLLSIFDSQDKAWLSFQPNLAYDRIEVVVGNFLGLLDNILIYEIQRSPTYTEEIDNLWGYYNQMTTIDGSQYYNYETSPQWYNSNHEYINSDLQLEISNLISDTSFYASYNNECNQLSHVEIIHVDVITLTPQSLTTGRALQPYSDNLSNKMIGLPSERSYRYEMAAESSLPPGLSLSSDGQITGTPTLAGSYDIEVIITDISDSEEMPTGQHVFPVVIAQALPIVLTQFDVKVEDHISNIQWTAENQSGIIDYQVQRSFDGIHWTSLIHIQPSNQYRDQYQYQDQTSTTGKIYYRLKIIEADQSFVYSKIVNVNYQDQIKSLINSYPNPSRNQIQIVNDQPQAITYAIYNVLGQELKTSESIHPKSRITVDISHMENGLFYIQYRDIYGKIISGEMRLKQ
ncbi:putative Ig domain-containing protein [Membranihabitans marinus]|uniref:putative Ig domain-containing protein n=1 Tax=Membranihabitans marinus TaxID=1227546 RepID=UPI001F26CA5E|nr:putative Ig domain-containing protein [Membranihabitans marinus]